MAAHGTDTTSAVPPPIEAPFVVVTYNMLEQGLAFGAIPWVMIVPQTLTDRAANFPEVRALLTEE
jgi:hypothetical protein